MALFTEYAPQTTSTATPNYSNSKWLKYLGYKQNGEENTWGKILNWVPIGGMEASTAARWMTKGTDSQDLIKQSQANAVKKYMIEAGLAASAGAALPALGVGTTVAGAGASGAAATGVEVGSTIGATTGLEATTPTANSVLTGIGETGANAAVTPSPTVGAGAGAVPTTNQGMQNGIQNIGKIGKFGSQTKTGIQKMLDMNVSGEDADQYFNDWRNNRMNVMINN